MSNFYGGDEVGALVFDLGSHTTKVGYAGEDQPRAEIPSVVAVNDVPLNGSGGGAQRKYFVGTVSVDVPRPGKEVKYFLKDGMIEDWDLFEKMIDSIYADYIHAESSQNPVMFSEPVWNTRPCREKLSEIMFERYNIPAFYLAKNAMLASFSVGRATSLILDSGAHHTTAVPVFEGHVLKNSRVRTPFGGDYVARLCYKQLREKGIELTPAFMIKSKQRVEVGERPKFEKKNLPEGITNSFRHYMLNNEIGHYKLATVKVYDTKYDAEEANKIYEPMIFEFPDGYQARLSVADQLTLMEPFFDTSFTARSRTSSTGQQAGTSTATSSAAPSPAPLVSSATTPPTLPEFTAPATPRSLVAPSSSSANQLAPGPPARCSYADLILSSIEKCDIDIRPALLNSIVVVGGNSLLPGFTDRLSNDLSTLLPHNFKVKIASNNTMIERKFATWIGGSIMASLGSFQQMWISKLEYEEQGKACLDFDAR